MAQLFRLIWRLDFGVSYSFLDRRGSVLRLLMRHPEGLWQNVGDGALTGSFVANFVDGEQSRTMSLEQASFNGEFAWKMGLPLEKAFEGREFRWLNEALRDLLRLCEIEVLSRVGIRFQLLERSNLADFRSSVAAANKIMQSEALGTAEHPGLIFEGKSEDQIRFRAMVASSRSRVLAEETAPLSEPEAARASDYYDVFADLDLFEENLSFREHSLYKWAVTKLEKAVAFAQDIRAYPLK